MIHPFGRLLTRPSDRPSDTDDAMTLISYCCVRERLHPLVGRDQNGNLCHCVIVSLPEARTARQVTRQVTLHYPGRSGGNRMAGVFAATRYKPGVKRGQSYPGQWSGDLRLAVVVLDGQNPTPCS